MKNVKNNFPIFVNNPDLVYLDSAATAQKPQQVIDAITTVYEKYTANIHRGMYDMSEKATALFEKTREKVAKFIGAQDPSEIIFTSGATEAINIVAYGWGRKYLQSGDIIVLSEMEHHSNIVPWLRLKDEIGVDLLFLPITEEGRLDYKIFLKNEINPKKIKLIALTHASNVLGTINPIAEIVRYFKEQNVVAKVLVDAAQSVPHLPIDVNALFCDFLAFSSHKMLGPSGVGVLWAKKELLDVMDPLQVGSHMIKKVTKEKATWANLPDKFEAGTRNIEGVIGLGAAVDYLLEVGMKQVTVYEKELTDYALTMFKEQRGVTLLGPTMSENRLGVFSFLLDGIHPHDAAEIFNRSHIAVRAGHHCAQPLMDVLGVIGTVRASLYLYNTKEDINQLIEGIASVKKVFTK